MSPLREVISDASFAKPMPDPHRRTGHRIVLEDLSRFGPDSVFPCVPLEAANRYCKSLATRHYENFSVASLLVPRRVRQDFYNVYSYCRWSDDLADEMDNRQDSLRLLNWWRAELSDCFSGDARHPVFIALRETILRHSLSIDPFENLLDAFVQDQSVVRYESAQDLLDYCQGSANPVGRILLQIGNVFQADAFALSDEICTGLQLANFCQDFQTDALRGRIYLPMEAWSSSGLTESAILSGKRSQNLESALADWVVSARTHLINGLPLVRSTPRWLSRDIQLFARGGLTILDNISRNHFNVWTNAINVSKSQKLRLLARAVLFPRSTHVADLARPSGTSPV